MKKYLAIALALVLVLSLGIVGHAEPVVADEAAISAQIDLIYSSFASIKQNESAGVWSYAVTDLDHNGRLEVLAVMKDASKTTYVNAWEVNADQSALVPCKIAVPQGQTFPYILSENADTFYDASSDSWSYLFYDNMELNGNSVYTFKYSVNLKEGILSFAQLATQCTMTMSGGYQQTAFYDANGATITPEQYNAAGVNAYINAVKSSTNLDWFGAAAMTAARLNDSYAVFKGDRQPDKTVPVIAYTPAPQYDSTPAYLSVTKSPTSESRYSGETAYFVSNATTWTSLSWTFVSAYGGEYSVDGFRSTFPYSSVGGASSTTLTISNVSKDMNNWGVYCTFYYNGQTARTNTAYIYVYDRASQNGNPDVTTCPNCGRTNVSIYSTCPSCGYDIYGYIFGRSSGPRTYWNSDGSATTIYPDGSSSTDYADYAVDTYGDGSTTYWYNDGTAMHIDPVGRVTEFDIYGNSTEYYADGTFSADYADGSAIDTHEDGSVTYWFNDGTAMHVGADGSIDHFDTEGNHW